MSPKIRHHSLTIVEELATHGGVVAGEREVGGDGAFKNRIEMSLLVCGCMEWYGAESRVDG